jgi:transposase
MPRHAHFQQKGEFCWKTLVDLRCFHWFNLLVNGGGLTKFEPKQEAQGALFYAFSIDHHVPQDHLLRSIDRFVDLSSIRAHQAPFYSHTGRPSIDPELLIRMLLVGYCLGTRSERRLCEEVHLNLAYRWFCRLILADAVPDHSTFSKNRPSRRRKHRLPGNTWSFPRQRFAAPSVWDDSSSVYCGRLSQRSTLRSAFSIVSTFCNSPKMAFANCGNCSPRKRTNEYWASKPSMAVEFRHRAGEACTLGHRGPRKYY